jgi:hypothetical protein
MIPQMIAAATVRPTRRARTHAEAAEDARNPGREVRRESRLPVSQTIGAAKNAIPMMFSP